MGEDLNKLCDSFRKEIKEIGEKVKCLMAHDDFKRKQAYDGQHGEMKANIMLAYRHLEDARMRIGKTLQAADDGISIFDKS